MTKRRPEWSADEEQVALHAFLHDQREAFPTLTVGLVMLDYSQASVVQAVRRIAAEVAAGRLDEAEQARWFDGLGYYFGETLRRGGRGLSWSAGKARHYHENLPVIAGFAGGEEADLIAICENIIYAVVTRAVPAERIDETVEHWFDLATSGKA